MKLTTTLMTVLTFMTLTAASASAAFIGNLDGTSNSSTFGTSTNTASPLYGWTAVTGAIRAHLNGQGTTSMIHLNNATANFTAQYDTDVALAPLTTYTMDVRVGSHTASNQITLINYTIEIGYLDGSNVWQSLDSVSNSYDGGDELSPTANGFVQTLEYSTGGTVPLGDVAVRVYRDTGSGRWNAFDYVTLDATPIPEPASLVLLSLGAGAMLLRRR